MANRKCKIDLEKLERLAATGASLESISKVLHIARRSLYQRRKDDKDVNDAYERGKAIAETSYATALREIALKKNEKGEYAYPAKERLKAIMFYLERQQGWQPMNKVDLQSSDSTMSPQPVVVPVGDMTPEEMARMARAAKRFSSFARVG